MIVVTCAWCGRELPRPLPAVCPYCGSDHDDESGAGAADCLALARLHAAAPDLLAACEDLLRYFGYSEFESVHAATVISAGRAAVAKAKGEEEMRT